MAYATGSTGLVITVRGSSRRIMIMRFRPAPVVNNLWFDVASVAGIGDWNRKKMLIASRIEEVGVRRVLYGTDGSWAGFTPVKGIAAFKQLPLTSEETRTVILNEPPYAK